MAFETQGKIVANYVKAGDKIYAGQPLLAIDSSTLQSQLKQAQAQLDALNIDTVKAKQTPLAISLCKQLERGAKICNNGKKYFTYNFRHPI